MITTFTLLQMRVVQTCVRIFFLPLRDRECKYVLMHVHVKYQHCLNITSMSHVYSAALDIGFANVICAPCRCNRNAQQCIGDA